MTDDDQVPDILKPEHNKRVAELRRAERAAKQPAVPAPASRSGEDHAAAKRWAKATLMLTLEGEEPLEQDSNLARCYLVYAALLSRDSGEAAKLWIECLRHDRAKAIKFYGGEPKDQQIKVGPADAILSFSERCELANLIESLSASAARLTEDNKRLQGVCDRGDEIMAQDTLTVMRLRTALEPFAAVGQWLFARNLPDDTPVVELQGLNGAKGALTRGDFKAAHTALRPSTAASPPEGQSALDEVEDEDARQQPNESGKAPADGAED